MTPSEKNDLMAIEHLGEAYAIAAELEKLHQLSLWTTEVIENVTAKAAKLAGLIQAIHLNNYYSYTGDEAVVTHLEGNLEDAYTGVVYHTAA